MHGILTRSVDGLVQALVLTAIVVGAAVATLLLELQLPSPQGNAGPGGTARDAVTRIAEVLQVHRSNPDTPIPNRFTA